MPGTAEAFSQAADTVAISASTTSASSAITAGFPQLLVTNTAAAPAVAFVTTGVGSATATATRLPINGGSQAVISVPVGHNTVAVILTAGTGTVYFTPGYGT